MAFFRQLVLLLWKNITFRRRNKIQLIIEIIWPLFLFVILIAVRDSNRPYKQGQCHFPNKALPSAGTLPWIQSMICNIHNPCLSQMTPGETPGQAGNFDKAIISRVFVDAQTLLSRVAKQRSSGLQDLTDSIQKLANEPGFWPNHRLKDYLRANETFSTYLLNNSGLSSVTVDQLLKARLNFRASRVGPQLKLQDLLCDINALREFLTVDEGDEALSDLQKQLCDLPADVISKAERLFLSQLDPRKLFTVDFLRANMMDLMNINKAIGSLAQDLSVITDSLSSFTDLREELRFVFLENQTLLPRRSSQAFSNIMCGYNVIGGASIPSLNWYEDDSVKSFLGKNDPEDKNLHHDFKEPFCRNLIQTLESNPLSSIVWRGMKPLLVGKLLYTPDTPAVQQVMKKVNQTFQDLQIFQDLNEAWLELGPEIKKFMETSMEIQILQSLLESPDFARMVNLLLRNTTWTASWIAHFLSKTVPDAPRNPGEPPTWLETYNDVDNAIAALARVTQCFSGNKLKGLKNEDQLINKALELLEDRKFWAGVVFLLPNTSSSELPPHVKYKIRMDIDEVTRTNKIKDRFWDPGPAADAINDMRYIWGGFVYVQDLVEKALTGVKQRIGIYVQQMPYPCYVDDVFLRVLNRSLPLFMTLAWIYSVAMIIKCVVYEKDARLKETMRIMGLNTGTLWLGWFISSLVPFLFSAALLIAILKWGDILPYSNPAVVFFFLSAFATATITQCLFISTIFSKANLAAACGGLIYFSLYLPYVLCVAWRDLLNTTHKVFASFLSPVAFGFGCEYFSQYEEQGIGIQWHNLWSSPVKGDSYNFSTAIVMLYVDAFIYIIAAWYIDAVFPGMVAVLY